jgi:FAD/FMN-containing dehydrogenase
MTREQIVQELRSTFQCRVVTEGDREYDEARSVWNGMIDRRPRAVVRVSGVDDIRKGIALARVYGLPLAVRGGGHNVAGNATVDDGLVLDLGGLRHVDVDAQARTVTVDPGCTLADVDLATEAHGLAVPLAVVSQTGIAGLTLGGGMGWLIRAHGLTVDNLLAAEVVTAAGESIRASETENPDLFWGLKGGGGNFGVVTSFTYRAHPMPPTVFGGTLIYSEPRWTEALIAWRAWTRQLDDRMSSVVTFLVPPPEFDAGDQVLLMSAFAWCGPDHAEGERALAPLRRAAQPDVENIEPTRWVDWQSATDSILHKGVRAYWKNAFLAELGDGLVEQIVEHTSAQTWLGTGADLHHFGGAFGRVPEEATPFPNRSAQYWLNIYGFWEEAEDDAHHTEWVRGLHEAVQPFAMAGSYVNALTADGEGEAAEDLAESIYGPRRPARLVELKRRYDPDNVFLLNHNIPPG